MKPDKKKTWNCYEPVELEQTGFALEDQVKKKAPMPPTFKHWWVIQSSSATKEEFMSYQRPYGMSCDGNVPSYVVSCRMEVAVIIGVSCSSCVVFCG